MEGAKTCIMISSAGSAQSAEYAQTVAKITKNK